MACRASTIHFFVQWGRNHGILSRIFLSGSHTFPMQSINWSYALGPRNAKKLNILVFEKNPKRSIAFLFEAAVSSHEGSKQHYDCQQAAVSGYEEHDRASPGCTARTVESTTHALTKWNEQTAIFQFRESITVVIDSACGKKRRPCHLANGHRFWGTFWSMAGDYTGLESPRNLN